MLVGAWTYLGHFFAHLESLVVHVLQEIRILMHRVGAVPPAKKEPVLSTLEVVQFFAHLAEFAVELGVFHFFLLVSQVL